MIKLGIAIFLLYITGVTYEWYIGLIILAIIDFTYSLIISKSIDVIGYKVDKYHDVIFEEVFNIKQEMQDNKDDLQEKIEELKEVKYSSDESFLAGNKRINLSGKR